MWLIVAAAATTTTTTATALDGGTADLRPAGVATTLAVAARLAARCRAKRGVMGAEGATATAE